MEVYFDFLKHDNFFFFRKIITVLIEFMKSTISLSDVNIFFFLWTRSLDNGQHIHGQSIILFMFWFDSRWERRKKKKKNRNKNWNWQEKQNKKKMFYDFRKWNKIRKLEAEKKLCNVLKVAVSFPPPKNNNTNNKSNDVNKFQLHVSMFRLNWAAMREQILFLIFLSVFWHVMMPLVW